MPELRKDPITGTWVIISEERKKRPKYYQIVVDKDLSIPRELPLLPGQRGHDAARDLRPAPGPLAGATCRAGTCASCPTSSPPCASRANLRKSGEGFYDKMNGIGAHEVIIETPRHQHTWFDGDSRR